jgi:hypothetical protein
MAEPSDDNDVQDTDVEPAKKAAPKPRKKKPPSDVRIGMRDSDDVRAVQEKLGLEQTGDYDAAMMERVKAWQNARGFVGGRGIWINAVQIEKMFNDSNAS